jgi:hypothetical protein
VRVSLLQGSLKGKGWEVGCEILVWRPANGSVRPNSQFIVIEAPSELPDGVYEVVFNGHTFLTEKRGWQMDDGIALSDQTWRNDRDDRRDLVEA